MPPSGTTILGLVAALCTTLSFLPQVVKTLKTKRTGDISLLMYASLSFGLLLWFAYGLLIRDLPLILSNAVSFSFAAAVLVMKIKNG